MTSQRTTLRNFVLLLTLTITGVLIAITISLPIPLLTGPAIITTVAVLAGLPLQFPLRLREAVFLIAGVTIGATVSPDSITALTRWPLAFVLLGVSVVLMMWGGQWLMRRIMQIDGRSALLAATPGHLSYVIALGEDLGLATERVAVVQSIRLFVLTLLVPFAARLGGIDSGVGLATAGASEMTVMQTALCITAAAALTPLAKRTPIPAPTLLAGMMIGAVARLSEFAPGGLSHWIAYPVLAAIGTLIGTRFVGVSMQALRRSALAGIVGTTLAATLTLCAAWLATGIVEMPLLHVVVAFAPGGLETMTVMGAAIGANPGFVAAAHVGRLLLISVLVPIMIARTQGPLPVGR